MEFKRLTEMGDTTGSIHSKNEKIISRIVYSWIKKLKVQLKNY